MNLLERQARALVRRCQSLTVPRALRSRWTAPSPPVDPGWQSRLTRFRIEIAPWLNRTRPLDGARILEIGSGQGASTWCLAEQGAVVHGIDLDQEALATANRIFDAGRLTATFETRDAATIDELAETSWDWVIFWASVEHMVHHERLASLTKAWELLAPGGLLTIIETPNRLWPHDSHTSQLPFFNWLPDSLAFATAPRSPRSSFGGSVYGDAESQMLDFLRRGRGVSFHEFDLALGDHTELTVASCLQLDRRARNPLRRVGWRLSLAGRTERVLHAYSPATDRAWLQPFLYLTLVK